ncbi:MAG: RagB/SusD family nutrient uptake outer membrane protein [Cytophagales bacterium]|nr:RagB/SusD family nutrient uptake outer membrane protein [Cytophagales bacterium]
MKLKIYSLVLVFLIFAGCSEDLLDEETPHILTGQSLYNSPAGFEAGINGLYAMVREEFTGRVSAGNNDGSNLTDDRAFVRSNRLRAEMFMSGTDNMVTNVQGPEFGELYEDFANEHNPFQVGLEKCFIWLYQVVNAANTIINQAESRTDVSWPSDADRNYVVAEARAIRAWAFRHISYAWGDAPMPLVESTGSTIRNDWERTPRSVIRRQMINDWRFAEEIIPVEPVIESRMTKGAVQTYLAEIYLAIGKPDSALIWADKCINTSEYQLVTARYGVRANEPGVAFMDMFYSGNAKRSEGNTEALWIFEHEFGAEGGGGSIMRRWLVNRYDQIRVGGVSPFRFRIDRGGRGIARMQPTTFMFDLYEAQDDRYSDYAVKQFMVIKEEADHPQGAPDRVPGGFSFGDTVFFDPGVVITPDTKRTRASYQRPYSRKYENLLPDNGLQEAFQWNDLIYLRLADTYLLKAEAELKLGRTGNAANTINVIRSRSNATPISAGDVDIDFILDERSRELFSEEHRRWTLVRTGKWLERVQLHNFNGGQTAAARDTIHPIPQLVIDANLGNAMPQNPGFN